jgi:hypothetical protein
MHQKKDRHLNNRGNANSGFWADRQQPAAATRGQTRRAGIPIPDVDTRWLEEVQSWFRSFKLSGQVELWEASDWSLLVAAARAYDMSIRTQSPGWFGNFVKLSARLGATIADRNAAGIVLDEPGPPADMDEQNADNVVRNWQERLTARKNPEGDKGA